ncbi:6947_t:CDS:2 [Diversispora eburnea]|uniref:mevalonate kinase n=1 Tax=Diversispora eburnea TaxID=1213867 RepID=A0A9N9AZ32_9GLOM|nr:6947_t:CDS:2 [Diversispora eburnea]
MSFLNRFLVSAPGKVILFGEHAVVYGKTAIAGSLDGLRTYALFEKRLDGYLELNFPDLGLRRALSWPKKNLPYHLIKHTENEQQKDFMFNENLLQALKPMVEEGNMDDEMQLDKFQRTAALAFLYLVIISSNLPIGAGLGSSASYSVCLATGLLLAFGHISIPDESNQVSTLNAAELINQWAFQAEKVIQGNPSGIDNAVATFGGAVSYKKGSRHTNLKGFHSFRFLLINTKEPRDAKTQIEKVRVKREKELIDLNHYLVNSLGVSHPSLEKIREITSEHNLHSKLTGAGGGGCALALVPDDILPEYIQLVEEKLVRNEFECYETPVGGHGVAVMDATTVIDPLEFLDINKNKLREIGEWKYFV